VAAGGIATGGAIAAVLALGAQAAMLGTAFLRCTEAGTSPAHATALGEAVNGTTLTRAFTGRPARAIRNDFVEALDQYAPAAYPEVHVATSPLRVEARRMGDTQRMHLWAGQAFRLAREMPAARLVDELVQETRRASERGRAITSA
jgi:nitronate monooxygenase